MTFNRTILELKSEEPLEEVTIGLALQSHHTGIEIRTDRFGKVSKEAFNRTILELK